MPLSIRLDCPDPSEYTVEVTQDGRTLSQGATVSRTRRPNEGISSVVVVQHWDRPVYVIVREAEKAFDTLPACVEFCPPSHASDATLHRVECQFSSTYSPYLGERHISAKVTDSQGRTLHHLFSEETDLEALRGLRGVSEPTRQRRLSFVSIVEGDDGSDDEGCGIEDSPQPDFSERSAPRTLSVSSQDSALAEETR